MMIATKVRTWFDKSNYFNRDFGRRIRERNPDDTNVMYTPEDEDDMP
jgi:hypothetical protein